MSLPSVSVLITCYNGEHSIRAAVESVLAQSFSDIDLVVVNDGSTDATLQALGEWTGNSRVNLMSLDRHRGRVAALNTGLSQARGRYIAILDSDDYWHPHKLALQVGHLERNPEVAILGTSFERFGPWGGPVKVDTTAVGHQAIYGALRRGVMPFAHSSLLIRRTAFDATGFYDPRFTRAQDFQWARRAAQAGLQMDNLTEVLTYYHVATLSHDLSYWMRNERFRRFAIRSVPLSNQLPPSGAMRFTARDLLMLSALFRWAITTLRQRAASKGPRP